MELLDGKKVKNDLIKLYPKRNDIVLAIIRLNSNIESDFYIRNITNTCNKLNIKVITYNLVNSSLKNIKEIINKLNTDNTTAIMIDLPNKNKNITQQEIINMINPSKDIDNLSEKSTLKSATTVGIIKMIDYYDIKLSNKRITIVGKGTLVGKPIAEIFNRRNIKYTLCDSKTTNLKEITKDSDLIITGTSVKHLITKDMVKENVIIIDAGVIYQNKKIYGNADFENIKDKASFITPPIGGVGETTTLGLIDNLYKIKEGE